MKVIEESQINHQVKLNQANLWYVVLLVTILRYLGPKRVQTHFEFIQAILWSIFMIFFWKILNLDGRALTVTPSLPDDVDFNGFNHVGGEDVFFITNPGLGLWAYRGRLCDERNMGNV